MRLFAGLLTLALLAMARPTAVGAEERTSAVARDAALRALVTRIERHHQKHDTFHARFEQRVVVRAHDKTSVRRGEVRFKRPGKLRFRYDDGDWVVSDGKRLRAYVRADARVYAMAAKRSLYPASLAFLEKKGRLAEQFRLRRIDTRDARAEGGVIVEALPKLPAPTFAKMLLFVEEKTGRILRVMVVDGQGNTNRFVFTEPAIGKPMADGLFALPKTPKGAKLVEP
jgi:outer membrane lipoprotein carrier protein